MKMIWNYGVVGLLTLAAAAVVATGETANAELRLVETAATIGTAALCFLASPASVASTPGRKTSVP